MSAHEEPEPEPPPQKDWFARSVEQWSALGGAGPPGGHARLIHNERIKLIANAYDRASTAAFGAGILGPVSTGFYQLAAGGQLPFGIGTVILFAVFWISLALFLHFQARHVLGSLRE